MKLSIFYKALRNYKTLVKVILIAVFLTVYLNGCSSKDEELGVGPVSEVKLASIDNSLVTKGEQLFTAKCSACHKISERLVGPPLKDVTKRRKPEWIMNMILNPQQMTQENPTAKELFATYLVQMTFQDVTQDDARAILEYFRSNDEGQNQTSNK
jgi:mono/diheme cytochrome c family protein